MKRFIVGILIGLLLAGVVVWAQGEWQGPQWEYLVLQVNNDHSVTVLPMVGDAERIGSYTASIQDQVSSAYAAFSGGLGRTDEFAYPFYLQTIGRDGWELTGEYPGGVSGQIFKRPKTN